VFSVGTSTFSVNSGHVAIGGVASASGYVFKVEGSTNTGYIGHPINGEDSFDIRAENTGVTSMYPLYGLDSANTGLSYLGFPNINHSAHTSDIVLGTRGAANALYVQNSGNVGIGTSSPQDLIHLYNGGGTTEQRLLQAGNQGTADSYGDIFEVWVDNDHGNNSTKLRARNNLYIYNNTTALTGNRASPSTPATKSASGRRARPSP